MKNNKFDPKKLQKLNNPKRLIDIPPDYVWGKLKMEFPGVFVDLGTGTAFFSIAFLRRFNPSKIYACDSSEVMINWMEENVSPKYPNIVPIKTDEHSIPLNDEIADLVFMINLHHELDTPSLTIKESNRLLKAGGKVLIVDWKKEDMPEGPPVEIRYLPEQIEGQLINAGFKQIDIYNDLQKHFVIVGQKVPAAPRNKG